MLAARKLSDKKRFSLGIRASLLLGFGAMALVMVVSTLTAVFSTERMSHATQDIVFSKLPATMEVMQIARATDALVAASGPLASITTTNELNAIKQRVEKAQNILQGALAQLADSNLAPDEVKQHTLKLNANLLRLLILVEKRIAVMEAIAASRQQLLNNRQIMHQNLSYRVRVLNSGGDMLRQLLQRPDTPTDMIVSLASSSAALQPIALFANQVETIHSLLLVSTYKDKKASLNLTQEKLLTSLSAAQRSFDKMPAPVMNVMEAPFRDLKNLTTSEQGLPSWRHEELSLLSEISHLIEENLGISQAVEAATQLLVVQGMQGIEEAAQEANRVQQNYLALLLVIVGLGFLIIGFLIVFHVDRYLIRRLTHLSRAMQRIAHGQLDTELPPEGRDELGRLGAAVRVFQKMALDAVSREKALEGLNKELSELSNQDALTGIANRRHFDEVLAIEWSHACRKQHPLSLIFFDIDHFKPFNDTYGHQEGDACLERVGAVLRERTCCAGELPARYGGEEFCILLPQTKASEALAFAEVIRLAVCALQIPHQYAQCGHVTISLGVATSLPDGEYTSAEELLRAADEALYQAKRSGRNKSLVAKGRLKET